MFENILVGVDGRQGGRDAIALAKRLAAPDATITLAHVYGSEWSIGRAAPLAFQVAREESRPDARRRARRGRHSKPSLPSSRSTSPDVRCTKPPSACAPTCW